MTSDQIIKPIKVARLTKALPPFWGHFGDGPTTGKQRSAVGVLATASPLPSPQNPTQHGKVGASLLGSELALIGAGPAPCQGKPPRMSKNIVGYATFYALSL